MEVDESNILDDEEGADTLASLEYTNLESDGLLALTRQLQVAKRIIFIILKMYFFFIFIIGQQLISYIWFHVFQSSIVYNPLQYLYLKA